MLGTAGLAAVGVGGAMAVGGAGAAIRASRIKAQPRKVYYGGSAEGENALRDAAAAGVDNAERLTGQGVGALQQGFRSGYQTSQAGAGLLQESVGSPAPGRDYESARAAKMGGMSLLNSYRPGEASRLAAQAASDQAGRQNLAAGATGGALGLRDAMYNNANSGQQIAQQAAVQRAQEEQALLSAKVNQQNMDRGVGDANYADAVSRRLQGAQIGAQIAGAGNGQVLQAGQGITSAGLSQTGLYLDQAQNVENSAFQANLSYEKARQEEKQRKSDRLYQFGGAVFSAGASVAAGGMGGKK